MREDKGISKRLNIAVVTTSRADYGLLSPLLSKLQTDEYFELHLIVTGSHLSDKHGMTVKNIIDDNMIISGNVEMTGTDDSAAGICQSISSGFVGFSNIFSQNPTDLLIVLGDRYELIPACISALIYKIPIAHIHGGEVTYGAWDDSIRHSVTKMASIHFPSINLYADRIIQMGEEPDRVYMVGALGMDNILGIPLMTKEELGQFSGADFSREVALMTYHPVTLDDYSLAAGQTRVILTALLAAGHLTIITMPNADSGNNAVYDVIQEYLQKHPDNFKFKANLGQKAYLSAMKYARLMIGNSSSGIIESSAFKIPVVNIGDRQAGRFRTLNIIDTECTLEEVSAAISRAASKEFADSLTDIESPYGDGNASGRIIDILKSINPGDKEKLLKKKFFDLPVEYFSNNRR